MAKAAAFLWRARHPRRGAFGVGGSSRQRHSKTGDESSEERATIGHAGQHTRKLIEALLLRHADRPPLTA
jgi:hypothetical protein